MIENSASVVLCTYNRAHLLKNSLVTYKKQTTRDFELIILDDGSEDDTESLVRSFSGDLAIRYERLSDKKPGEWRDAGAIINRGIIMSQGEFVYITHPEVMVCFDCIENANSALRENENAYFNARVYYMTPHLQKRLETIDWQSDFYQVRTMENFYRDSPDGEEYLGMTGNQYYTPKIVETIECWESWVFGGMTRRAWKKFGGLNESPHWGTVDYDFQQRRRMNRWKTVSPRDIYVIHQNHDTKVGKFEPTKRNRDSMLADALDKYGKKRNFLKDMEL
ncbi:MAG: glycosyltransferase [Candidatus Eremiobacteraeota bacterium]|nr:glycosyltransferase [Candidatus Eremiobacteraeota bacterium]